MPTFAGSILKYPAQAACYWYLALIALGTGLLMLPVSRQPTATPISAVDALFTSTSAACVTGLSVRSTPNDFSFFGQIVITVLIQLGGIGTMTVTTFITLRFGRGETLRQRVVLAETLGAKLENDMSWVLRNVLWMVVIFEAIGFAVLAVWLLIRGYEPSEAIWEALFHSVAAFCNAGFGLYDDNLTPYQNDPVVNFTVMALIIIGGLGFPVLFDLLRYRRLTLREQWVRYTLHTKMMLIGTVLLLTLGTLAILLMEQETALAGMSWPKQIMVALFHSTSTRTAGFNTVPIGSFTNATLFIFILLMMIGAGPCSTGGGFKVSTFMILVLHAKSRLFGEAQVKAFRRSIPAEIIGKAIASAFLFTVVVGFGLTAVLIIEQSRISHHTLEGSDQFLDAMFECASALGTVGLSTGITPHLTDSGKLVIILLMFIGRLGPISVFMAVSRSQRDALLEYPPGEILVG